MHLIYQNKALPGPRAPFKDGTKETFSKEVILSIKLTSEPQEVIYGPQKFHGHVIVHQGIL